MDSKGYHFPQLIHPDAIIEESVKIGYGSQIMAGAVVQIDCEIGINCVVNTNAGIDHDCKNSQSCVYFSWKRPLWQH